MGDVTINKNSRTGNEIVADDKGDARLDDDHVIHCALLGDGMVGKTCMILSYTQNTFTDRYIATVFDNFSVPLTVRGQDFSITIFDTAGQSDYERLRSYTYEECEVLLLCFSVCDRESYCNIIDHWLPEIFRHTKGRRPLLLVGTQTDLRTEMAEKHISHVEGCRLAKLIEAECYVECSACSQDNLQQVFEQVIISALKDRKRKKKFINRLFGRQRTFPNKSIKQISTMFLNNSEEKEMNMFR